MEHIIVNSELKIIILTYTLCRQIQLQSFPVILVQGGSQIDQACCKEWCETGESGNGRSLR